MSMYIAILGRQPAISIYELERLYGAENVAWLSDKCAQIKSDDFDFNRLGGSRKGGKVILRLSGGDWRTITAKISEHYRKAWSGLDHKITLGISTYDIKTTTRDIQIFGLKLKKLAHSSGGSLRLIPNSDLALSTATSHHNKLGLSLNKLELLVVKAANGEIIVAESVGAQNITALAARDQARPKTDAFVGMLPPKLARMMVNMATGSYGVSGTQATSVSSSSAVLSGGEGSVFPTEVETRKVVTSGSTVPEPSDRIAKERVGNITILDPFCGTGVVLQEAALLGFRTYGSDLSDKMVDYARTNLAWLRDTYQKISEPRIEAGDAIKHRWQGEITTVASETYLGQPFSAPPSHDKLVEVQQNCNHIIAGFLANIAKQLAPNTTLCLAIPAWRDNLGNFTHLPLLSDNTLARLGYSIVEPRLIRRDQLLYYRENQIVARELLLLSKS